MRAPHDERDRKRAGSPGEKSTTSNHGALLHTVGGRKQGLIFALTHARGRSPYPLLATRDARGRMLDVHWLTKRFGATWALRGASFSIRSGEILGLVGPNGSGKTTLLECLAGLLATDGGRVRRDEPLVPNTRRDVLFYMPDGIVPWPDQTVGWALQFSAALQGASREDAVDIARALDLVSLERQRIGTLSKGQRKRMLIALALLTPQPLVLLDEPFDGLDLRQTRDAGPLFRSIAARGRALLLSIHQLHDAVRVCDRLVLLSDGLVVGEGTLDELRARAGLPNADVEEVFLALT